MTIDDVSEEPHGERVRQFMNSVYGKTGMPPDLTYNDLVHCQNLATAEMLDEIHMMLRELLKLNQKD